jgi:hypothetical protein
MEAEVASSQRQLKCVETFLSPGQKLIRGTHVSFKPVSVEMPVPHYFVNSTCSVRGNVNAFHNLRKRTAGENTLSV